MNAMRSRVQLEITTLGSSSWMPYAPQGNDDDHVMKILRTSN
jgi:hypothetical protein